MDAHTNGVTIRLLLKRAERAGVLQTAGHAPELPNRRIGKNKMPSYSIPTSSSYYRGKPLSQSGGTGKQDSFKSEEVGRKSGLLDK